MAADGTWQLTNMDVSALNDGTITFTATTTNAIGHSAQSSISATKNTLGANSLSGRVFVDSNGNGQYDATEPTLAGITITVTGVDPQGNPIPSQTATTDADGTYSFTNLPAGTYSIVEAQPAKLVGTAAHVGSLGAPPRQLDLGNRVAGRKHGFRLRFPRDWPGRFGHLDTTLSGVDAASSTNI